MKVEYLHRKEIDAGKWDELISRSPAETLYPYSWYLDASAENWSALVMDDYRFVMPLVWKKKYGIRYLYQPVFCQQLGVFSKEYVDPLIIRQFIEKILKKFRFGVVHFNMKNLVGEERSFEVTDRSNYILSLDGSYEALQASYSVNARRNLKRSQESGTSLEKDVDLDEMIRFKRECDLVKKDDAAYSRMKSQFKSIADNSKGVVYGVHDGGKLLAAAFLAFSKTRIIYLQSVSSTEGKEQRAMFRIVDEVIRDYSGSALKLDFEGSNIPSIARFFGGFGARPEIYQALSFNRLPAPLILGKKYGR